MTSSTSGSCIKISPDGACFVLLCRRNVEPVVLLLFAGDDPVGPFFTFNSDGGKRALDRAIAVVVVLPGTGSLFVPAFVPVDEVPLGTDMDGGGDDNADTMADGLDVLVDLANALLLSGSTGGMDGSICCIMERMVSCSRTQNCIPPSNSCLIFLAVRAFIISFFNTFSSACCSSNDTVGAAEAAVTVSPPPSTATETVDVDVAVALVLGLTLDFPDLTF